MGINLCLNMDPLARKSEFTAYQCLMVLILSNILDPDQAQQMLGLIWVQNVQEVNMNLIQGYSRIQT